MSESLEARLDRIESMAQQGFNQANFAQGCADGLKNALKHPISGRSVFDELDEQMADTKRFVRGGLQEIVAEMEQKIEEQQKQIDKLMDIVQSLITDKKNKGDDFDIPLERIAKAFRNIELDGTNKFCPPPYKVDPE